MKWMLKFYWKKNSSNLTNVNLKTNYLTIAFLLKMIRIKLIKLKNNI